MKRLLRPAFVVTTCATIGACSDPKAPNDAPADSSGSPDAKPAYTLRSGHPVDADGDLVFFRGAGSCYVQKPKKEKAPDDLMSGERWVDDVDVPCPKEFDDPAFAAIGDGKYWIQNDAGECSQAQMFGNPPPPPVVTPCPPPLQKK